jgi:hypothetical protein
MPYATNHGVRLYYETMGQGPPIILIHGDFSSLEDCVESRKVVPVKVSKSRTGQIVGERDLTPLGGRER